eukprot:m.48477 g.48477  ORF g.48477 m.48477 type:complete len:91 (+) comp8918_c0_seq1:4002-4274(+)
MDGSPLSPSRRTLFSAMRYLRIQKKQKQPVNAVDSHEGSFTNLRFNMVDEGREKTCPHNPSRINITYTRCKRARNVFHHDLDFNNIFWIS